MKIILIAVYSGLILSACAWVKVTSKGEGVRLVHSASTVESCKKLGKINTQVISKILFFDRDTEKIADELADLARNEAALMGGDTIVPISEIHEGRRSFNAYQCFPVKTY